MRRERERWKREKKKMMKKKRIRGRKIRTIGEEEGKGEEEE
jgi:hypothetical protein